MLKASVVLSFYNRIDYLKLVLAGIERQTFKDFEIIIADDGSSPEAVNDVERISSGLPYTITHLWHEDKGFRKNKILNQAITSAKADYLIFIDADCVPHPCFVNEHLTYMQPGKCLTGRRVNLSEKMTRILTTQNIREGFLEKKKLLLISDGIFGKSIDIEKGFYFRSDFLRRFFNRKKRGLLGCNFSIYKDDFLKINGFDERYEAPSIGEDSDVEFRLSLNGVIVESLNNIAVQYHLFHKLQPRPEENLRLFEEVKRERKYYTLYGINK